MSNCCDNRFISFTVLTPQFCHYALTWLVTITIVCSYTVITVSYPLNSHSGIILVWLRIRH